MGVAMTGGDRETLLSCVTRFACDTGQTKRTTGDGFQAHLRVGEPHEQCPPGIVQCHCYRIEATGFEILDPQAVSATLARQFIEGVLTGGAMLCIPSRSGITPLMRIAFICTLLADDGGSSPPPSGSLHATLEAVLRVCSQDHTPRCRSPGAAQQAQSLGQPGIYGRDFGAHIRLERS